MTTAIQGSAICNPLMSVKFQPNTILHPQNVQFITFFPRKT